MRRQGKHIGRSSFISFACACIYHISVITTWIFLYPVVSHNNPLYMVLHFSVKFYPQFHAFKCRFTYLKVDSPANRWEQHLHYSPHAQELLGPPYLINMSEPQTLVKASPQFVWCSLHAQCECLQLCSFLLYLCHTCCKGVIIKQCLFGILSWP
jgi:hypothetical protein